MSSSEAPPDPSIATVSMHGIVALRAPLARGVCVGRYVVLDRVGEGGMGVVYKAYDPELERQVALKLLHAGSGELAADASRHERLLREAKALARLSHPNVVAVFDVGTFEGDVFIATEFVEGVTLHAWLRKEERSHAEILRVMLEAGDGLAAAHRAGLVHRDFKPANVIVAPDGRAKVLDFGLARADGSEPAPGSLRSPLAESPDTPARIEDASPSSPSSKPGLLDAPLTRFGEIMGTPRYMAPEQHACGPVDARSDQWSFCVSLWEALYREPPFEKGSDEYASSVVRGKLRAAPEKSGVPRRLHALLARGLSTLPDDRWPSMDALLGELRRDRSASRRRALAAVALIASAVIGVGAAAWARREPVRVCRGAEQKLTGVWDDARARAVRGALEATGKPQASVVATGAVRAFDDYARRWTSMRTDACEATRVRGEQSEELLDLRMECLDVRLEELRAQVDVLAHADAAMVDEAIRAAQSLPPLDVCANVGVLRAPVRPPSHPAARARVDEVRGTVAVGKAQQRVGAYADALATATKAADDAAAIDYAPVLAEALFLVGDVQDDVGDYKTSEKTLRRSAAAALAGRHETVEARALTALVAVVGLRQARFEEAHEWALLAEAAASHGDAYVRGELARNLGRLLYREGKFEEARASIERCLATWRAALGPDDLAMAGPLTDLGNAYFAEGKYDEAAARYVRSIEVLEKALGEGNPRLGANVNNLGEVYIKQGDLARADATLERARALWAGSLGESHPKVGLVLFNLGIVALRRGELDRAEQNLERALAIDEMAFGKEHPDVAMVLAGLGEVELARGHAAAAVTLLRRALAMREKLGGDALDRADAELLLARALALGLARGVANEPTAAAEVTMLEASARAAYVAAGVRALDKLRDLDLFIAAAAQSGK